MDYARRFPGGGSDPLFATDLHLRDFGQLFPGRARRRTVGSRHRGGLSLRLHLPRAQGAEPRRVHPRRRPATLRDAARLRAGRRRPGTFQPSRTSNPLTNGALRKQRFKVLVSRFNAAPHAPHRRRSTRTTRRASATFAAAELLAESLRTPPRPRVFLSGSSAVQDLLSVGSGASYDEPCSSTRIHNARVRVRDGPLSGSGDEPRDYLRRGEGARLPAPRASPQSHLDDERVRPRGSGCKSVVSVPSRNTVDWCAMARSGARTATPSVHTTVRTARSTLSFYQADCLDVFASLPSASVSVIVTSPPYNLGDRLPLLRRQPSACGVPANGPRPGRRRRPACWSLKARCS